MNSYSVSEAQTHFPRLVKKVAAHEISIAITQKSKTIAYVVSAERMDAILETMEILGNPKAMKAIRDYEAGKTKFFALSALDDLED